MSRRTGGGNLCEVFAITTNAFATKQLSLSKTIKTDVAKNDDNTYTITLTQEEDSAAFQALIDTYGPGDSAEATEEVSTYEDGSTAGGGASSSQPRLGIIVYSGAGKAADDSNDRKVIYAVCVVASGSGSWSTENGKPSQPTIVFKTLAPTAATTVPTTIWADGSGTPARKNLVTTPGAAKTIPTTGVGSKGKVDYLPAP